MDITKAPLPNLSVYALAGLGTLVAQQQGWQGLEFLCKPLMLIILSSWFFFNTRRFGDRFTLLVQAGLFFSLIGDVALMFTGRDQFAFIVGLAAFMLAQLCYFIAFAINVFSFGGRQGVIVAIIISLGLIAYALFFSNHLMPRVDIDLQIPVVGFVVVITLMGMAAAFRHMRTYLSSFLMVLFGALLLIVFDSLLTNDRFVRPMDGLQPIWMLVSYALAQLMIAAGCIIHVRSPERIRLQDAMTT